MAPVPDTRDHQKLTQGKDFARSDGKEIRWWIRTLRFWTKSHPPLTTWTPSTRATVLVARHRRKNTEAAASVNDSASSVRRRDPLMVTAGGRKVC